MPSELILYLNKKSVKITLLKKPDVQFETGDKWHSLTLFTFYYQKCPRLLLPFARIEKSTTTTIKCESEKK